MKAFVGMIAVVVLVPAARAEQGDAEDRALTEQMLKQTLSEDAGTMQQPNAGGYGYSGKVQVQSGHSTSKEKKEKDNSR